MGTSSFNIVDKEIKSIVCISKSPYSVLVCTVNVWYQIKRMDNDNDFKENWHFSPFFTLIGKHYKPRVELDY